MNATTSSKRALDDAETQPQPIEVQVPVCCGCGKSNVKYRCPRCEGITCSLHCCVEHKKKVNEVTDKKPRCPNLRRVESVNACPVPRSDTNKGKYLIASGKESGR
ncbi:hypothetical protein PsorP6_016022 [Peronosclerospora sorghi]|uniref:Uncharacterized protein n=1 Tax=Peronosclerospora sorghi TaxID=230839 RepID=A0ACC0WNH8_9STRA|nr:hypothetical protein PsorP6_016022 [Peronosclerospora sorghi]